MIVITNQTKGTKFIKDENENEIFNFKPTDYKNY